MTWNDHNLGDWPTTDIPVDRKRHPRPRYRDHTRHWRRVGHILGAIALTAGVATLLVFMTLGWLSGCGELYTDAHGERHMHECIWTMEDKP